MRQALLILPEAPYPAIGGGALRTASIIQGLAPLFKLTAVHFRLSGEADPAFAYPPNLLAHSHVIDLPHHSKSPLKKITRNLKRAFRNVPPLVDRFAGHESTLSGFLKDRYFDLIWVEHFWAATYAPVLKAHTSKLLLDLQNVEHAYYDSLAATSPLHTRPLFRHFAKNARDYEARLFPQFDVIVTTSEDDSSRVNHPRLQVFPNTIPWHDLPSQLQSESIVFTGNFAYTPNQQGLHWFLQNCWPALLKRRPNLRLRLVGKEIRYAYSNHPNIDYVGPVEDAIEEIAKSPTAIVPLLSGSGTRLKIIEAWAAGTAVVSTPLGAEGLIATPGQHLKIAKSPGDFTQSILDLFDNESTRSRIAQAARSLYEAKYTWQSARKILSELDL